MKDQTGPGPKSKIPYLGQIRNEKNSDQFFFKFLISKKNFHEIFTYWITKKMESIRFVKSCFLGFEHVYEGQG